MPITFADRERAARRLRARRAGRRSCRRSRPTARPRSRASARRAPGSGSGTRRRLDVDGQPRPLLDQVAADHARVVRGAAGGDRDAVDAEQLLVGRGPRSSTTSPPCEALADRLAHRLGLLVDLLEHERLVAALLGGGVVPVDVVSASRSMLAAVEVEQLDALGRDHDELAVARSSLTSRVCSRNATTSDATNVSPSPRPSTSGHCRRAPTIRSGCSGETTQNAKWPSQLEERAADGLDEVALVVRLEQVRRRPRRRSRELKRVPVGDAGAALSST